MRPHPRLTATWPVASRPILIPEVPTTQSTDNTLHLDYIRLTPNADHSDAREPFKAHAIPEDDEGAPYMMRYNMFVLIDDESLKSILEGPEPLTEL